MTQVQKYENIVLPATREVVQISFQIFKLSDQTRPKKFAEGGVCTRERADDVLLSRIQACARGASLKRLRG